mmetsp:Transcript_7755/g.16032  ORF Transcript_7755/g.16032 Transcript_7755/m.16032 type:complete len:817 (-) Transcript_7755:123-2573(-)|eukprot:CAMPEP_0168747222 /NCGR_PEP_ID=MMETSP0724-20121128/15550_1 /TAXON_ID=265536 /ORGANISM="Amphiprora sp., Strain CCMP467" /LENGTH=816 /DNA_ID=CAMNT_0008795015 /DNA_START=328 /DNA_END=2778 /DNA_ORIENTATION=+
MCQILGMNCASPTDFSFSLKGFCRRGGETDKHEHGWGLVVYEPGSKGCRSFHDVEAACRSPLAQFLLQQGLKTHNMMAHIRYATVGAVEMENVHPFTRELFGMPLSFCHNGECPACSQQPLPRLGRQLPNKNNSGTAADDTQPSNYYQPIGRTDSEAVFCAILNALRERYSAAGQLPSEAELFPFLSQLCQEIVETTTNNDNNNSSSSNMPTIFNFLLACGPHTLFAYSWPGARPGSQVWNGLHYIIRQPPFLQAQLIDDEDCCIDFSQVTTPDDRVAVVTTKPLTREAGWKEVPKGQLVLFQRGQLYTYNDLAVVHNEQEEECTTTAAAAATTITEPQPQQQEQPVQNAMPPCHETTAEDGTSTVPRLVEETATTTATATTATDEKRTSTRMRKRPPSLFSKHSPGVVMASGLMMLVLLLSLSSSYPPFVTASARTGLMSGGATTTTTTPIGNWLPSYAASCAQGTVVAAVECQLDSNDQDNASADDLAVLLVMQTPNIVVDDESPTNVEDKGSSSSSITVGGLELSRVRVARAATTLDEECIFPPYSGLTFLSGGGDGYNEQQQSPVVCAMTGFMPDVDYVRRHLQSHVETQRLVYNSNDNHEPVAQLATLLGRVIREYERQSDRPLGLQTLLVGWSRSSSGNADSSRVMLPRFYTSDPSGQVRSWNGGGTVMGGLTAGRARQLLYQRFQALADDTAESDRRAASPVQALQAILASLHKALLSGNEDDASPKSSSLADRQPEKNEAPRTWRRRRTEESSSLAAPSEQDATAVPADHKYQACLLWRSRDGTPWCGVLAPEFIHQQLQVLQSEVPR